MALTYRTKGHQWPCSNNRAWDCIGSSNAYYGGTEKAWYSTQAGGSAWHQQFQNSGNLQSNLSSPNACGGTAYLVPHANFMDWLGLASQLGHPRSAYMPFGANDWIQYFANGRMIADTFGGDPIVIYPNPNPCY
ncbi:MAG: hypothetical protein WEE64_11530 [Dehalococcoidia bacterium]